MSFVSDIFLIFMFQLVSDLPFFLLVTVDSLEMGFASHKVDASFSL